MGAWNYSPNIRAVRIIHIADVKLTLIGTPIDLKQDNSVYHIGGILLNAREDPAVGSKCSNSPVVFFTTQGMFVSLSVPHIQYIVQN